MRINLSEKDFLEGKGKSRIENLAESESGRQAYQRRWYYVEPAREKRK